MICPICKEPVSENEDVDFHFTYWNAVKIPIHKAHSKEQRQAYKLAEAFECQSIDADCNDCKHFQRGQRMILHGVRLDSYTGYCHKLDKPTVAHVNFATGNECFEHRKV